MYTTPESLGLCPYCHRSGEHKVGCPNYEPPVVCSCGLCDGDIRKGDEIVLYDGIKYHAECFLDEYEKEA